MTVVVNQSSADAAALAAAGWDYPGIGVRFDRAVEGLPLVEDQAFGTAAVAPSTSVGKAVRNLVDLSNDWRALEGDYNTAEQLVGGTGEAPIAATISKPSSTLNSTNHVFEANALRLSSALGAGDYGITARGGTVAAGAGLNVNGASTNVPTTFAALGLTAGDVANVAVGDVAVVGDGGLVYVTAKDSTSFVLRAISRSTLTADKTEWAANFTRFCAAPLSVAPTNLSSTTLQFSTAIPARAVVGMHVRFSSTPGSDAQCEANRVCAVTSIAADRLSCTLDRPVWFADGYAGVGTAVVFVPALTIGQIWSKRAIGPHVSGKRVTAFRAELTMPAMSHYYGNPGAYTKAQQEAALAAAPSVNWGYWMALWTFTYRPPHPQGNSANIVPGWRDGWSEVDALEVIATLYQGPSQWSGNLHQASYTRRAAMAWGSANQSRAVAGATWADSAADAKVLTPNRQYLNFPTQTLCDGQKHAVGVVWTRDRLVHYWDDQPVCESEWSVDVDYPHQIGILYYAGTFVRALCQALAFPHTNAQATGQFLKVHSVKVWEA